MGWSRVLRTWHDEVRFPTPTEADRWASRTWTRRIRWSEDGQGNVKLKFEEGEAYREVCIPEAFAQTVWDRFKSGQTSQEAVSIFAGELTGPSRKVKQGAGDGARQVDGV